MDCPSSSCETSAMLMMPLTGCPLTVARFKNASANLTSWGVGELDRTTDIVLWLGMFSVFVLSAPSCNVIFASSWNAKSRGELSEIKLLIDL